MPRYNGYNHHSGTYDTCSPYQNWDSEGGDCADFVYAVCVMYTVMYRSQCLIAGGHPALTGDAENCRGFCGKVEVRRCVLSAVF